MRATARVRQRCRAHLPSGEAPFRVDPAKTSYAGSERIRLTLAFTNTTKDRQLRVPHRDRIPRAIAYRFHVCAADGTFARQTKRRDDLRGHRAADDLVLGPGASIIFSLDDLQKHYALGPGKHRIRACLPWVAAIGTTNIIESEVGR